MEFEDIIQKVESKQEFKDWKEKHEQFYLAHAFVMLDKENEGIWQIGYYDKQSNMVATAILEGDSLSFIPEQEIIKATQEIIQLDPKQVKINMAEALDVAKECIKKNYPKELVLKNFFIIQHLEEGTVFNITYLTQTFKTINIKISTIDGKIFKHSMEKLANFC